MRRAAAVDRDLAIHQQLFGRQEKSRRVAALVARRNMMSGSRGPDEFRAELARISHTIKRIGAPNQRKLLCHSNFAMI